MPPKRLRTAAGTSSSTTRPTFDRKRFLSAPKEEYFQKHLSNLVCVPERGMENIEGEMDEFGMQGVLDKRRWGQWVSAIPDACEVLVREFYTNSRYDSEENRPAIPSYTSWFRGITVSYDSESIRAHLGLLTEEEEKSIFPQDLTFHSIINNPTPALLESMEQALVAPGRSWKLDDQGRVLYLLRKDMTPMARVWAQFVLNTLTPTSHKSETRWHSLVALYCIIKDLPMDVARMISFRIHRHYNSGNDNPRPIFPHIITALVLQTRKEAGRPDYIFEQKLKPAPLMSRKAIKRLFDQTVSKLGANAADEQEELLGDALTPPQPSLPSTWMEEAFGRMFLRQDRLHRDLDLMWRAGDYAHPDYQGPLVFNNLEQRLVNMSLTHDDGPSGTTAFGNDGADDDGGEDGDDFPMNE